MADFGIESVRYFKSMRLFRSLILVCLICHSCVVGEVRNVGKRDDIKGCTLSPESSISNARIYRSSIDRFVDKLFHETDTNEDGMVSFDEAYVGCLLLYVQLNRQAPIPPPSREKFRRIFLQAAGKKRSNELNLLDKGEYGNILKRIVARAIMRLTSHKIVTLVGAPLLAELIVRSFSSRKEGFEGALRFILPSKFHDAIIPNVTSTAFQRSFWMIILILTLGNVCLASVTFLLDLSLPKTQSVQC